MVTWILMLMTALQADAPWRDTYLETARAIDRVAHASPIYDGEDGAARSAATLVAIAFMESHFKPDAVAEDGAPTYCLGQVDPRGLMATAEQLRADVDLCVNAMAQRARESVRVCALRGRAPLERLGQYTGGGGGCDRGLEAARRRGKLADWLVRRWPVRWVEAGGLRVRP